MNYPVYMHYKGGYYKVITFNLKAYNPTELDPTADQFLIKTIKSTVEHNLESLEVKVYGNETYIAETYDTNLINQRLVLYQPVSSNLKYWIRTYDNFFEKIDKYTPRFIRILR